MAAQGWKRGGGGGGGGGGGRGRKGGKCSTCHTAVCSITLYKYGPQFCINNEIERAMTSLQSYSMRMPGNLFHLCCQLFVSLLTETSGGY